MMEFNDRHHIALVRNELADDSWWELMKDNPEELYAHTKNEMLDL